MNSKSSAVARASSAAVPSSDLADRVSALYDQAPRSDYVFGSPLGPFYRGGHEFYIPRFVYFGPHTSQESVRLAVFAGLGRHDRLAANAVVAFIEELTRRADIGQSLNVSFFPVVNVVGLLGAAEERDLAGESWSRSREPEIALLGREARRAGYRGFVRVTTTTDDAPAAHVTTIRSGGAHASHVEVLSLADLQPWAVRFETVDAARVHRGPLTLADDLPVAPFEVELAIPADWPQRAADRAVAQILRRLIVGYRAFLAYGQHL